MKRPALILAAGFLVLSMLACSVSVFGSQTPFPTSIFLPSPTPVSASPIPGLPSPTTAFPTSAAPTATTAAVSTPGGIIPGSPSGPYGVIRVVPGDILNIRSGPGAGYPVVGTFGPTAKTVMRTGPSAWSGDSLWVEVQNPGGGNGWVNSRFLTEYVPPATFCADTRVNTLLTNLAHALTTSDGAQLASLVSPAQGMDVRRYRYATVVNYDPAHAQYLFESTYAVNWGPAPGSGLDNVGSFQTVILPGLQEVFNATYILSCNAVQTGGASYDTSWPPIYANVNFYSVYKPGPTGLELSWRTVLVGVDYVNGQPYLFSLAQMEWEP